MVSGARTPAQCRKPFPNLPILHFQPALEQREDARIGRQSPERLLLGFPTIDVLH